MRAYGKYRLQPLARRLWRHVAHPGAILLYHRVTELESDPQLLAVSPHHFDQQLQILQAHTNVLSLQEFVQRLKSCSLPPNAVTITFDDGYADNLLNAKPLLEKYQLPATVFVATGHIDTSIEFYWDELERIFLQPGELPSTLTVPIGDTSIQYLLSPVERYTEAEQKRYASWSVLSGDDPTPRHTAYRSLSLHLRSCPQSAQLAAIDFIRQWANVGANGRPSHRSVTTSELIELGRGSLIEIGAHTVTHTLLSAEDQARQLYEITESKRVLETLLQKPIQSFSYPYGDFSAYNHQTVQCVREAKFNISCANVPGLAWTLSDVLQLPRFLVRNWGSERFHSELLTMMLS